MFDSIFLLEILRKSLAKVNKPLPDLILVVFFLCATFKLFAFPIPRKGNMNAVWSRYIVFDCDFSHDNIIRPVYRVLMETYNFIVVELKSNKQ